MVIAVIKAPKSGLTRIDKMLFFPALLGILQNLTLPEPFDSFATVRSNAPGAGNRHRVARRSLVATDSQRMEAFDAQHVSERSCELQCEENLFDSLRMAGEDSPFVARFGESLQPLVSTAFNHAPSPRTVRIVQS